MQINSGIKSHTEWNNVPNSVQHFCQCSGDELVGEGVILGSPPQ